MDPHRQPRDRDRSAISDRIRHAAEQGRIGTADQDIRLRNVASAQSMGELDLIARDLDLMESTLTPNPSFRAGAVDAPLDRKRGSSRPGLVVAVAVLAIGIIGAGVLGLVVFSSGAEQAGSDGMFEPQQLASPDAETGGTQSLEASPVPDTYALTGPGIRAFLADYQRTFDTPLAVDLTLYGDYAVVQVPQANRNRHAGLLYRKGEGWQKFGGVSANFPGSRTVDIRTLDVAALVRNIARARRALNVEDPTQTYVIVQHISTADPLPSVDIHVANEFNESGYLATRLDGTVERAFPYAPQ